MGFPGEIKFSIHPIILPSVATRVSFGQLSVLSTTLNTKRCGVNHQYVTEQKMQK